MISMLFKSGYNLNRSVISIIDENDQITVYSAYTKLDQLEEYNHKGNIDRIVVRWEIEDLVKGVSDFESLYHYCKYNNIALYRNTRIHLKAIWNNENTVLFGSANVTGKGMGERGVNYNYELSGIANPISFEDISYLNYIIQVSELVNESLFIELKNIVDQIELPTIEIPELPTKKKMEDEFLLSQLPMTASPKLLLEILTNPNTFSLDDQLKAAHDKALYDVNIEEDPNEVYLQLKERFNNKAIIRKLKTDIMESPRNSMGYGQVVRWIQDNTTSVPTPMSWEIKKEQFVNNLYEWICCFDYLFSWDRPSHSQVIYYNKQ
jgi:hypothetical protein